MKQDKKKVVRLSREEVIGYRYLYRAIFYKLSVPQKLDCIAGIMRAFITNDDVLLTRETADALRKLVH